MNISFPWRTFNLQHLRKGRLFPCFWFFRDTNSHSFNLSAGGKPSIIDALFHPPNTREAYKMQSQRLWHYKQHKRDKQDFVGRHHNMETLSVLLSFCEGNPPVTGRFPSQRTSNTELWCFYCHVSKQAIVKWWKFEMPWCSCDIISNYKC